MLDANTSALLEKINTICGEGGFRVVEEEDLLSALPAPSAEGLRRALRDLREQNYIDLKYAEDGVYCLCPLPEGRRYADTVRERRNERACRRRETAIFSFLGGFCGSALSALAAVAILFLLRAVGA